MSAEQNKALARRYFECLDRRDLDGLLELCAPRLRFHGLAARPLDPAGVREAMSGFYAAFPDSRMLVDDIVAEADRVAIRHTFRGMHQGEFQGIPPTGTQVSMSGIVILQVEDGRFTEGWLNLDALGLLQQLGAVPAPETARR